MNSEILSPDELAAWTATYRRSQAPGSDRCPSDDLLVLLAEQKLEPAERQRLADHVLGCRRCSRELALLMRVHREAIVNLAGSTPHRGWSWSRVVPLVASAAAVLLGAFLLWHPRPTTLLETTPETEGSDTALRGRELRSDQALEPQDGATLAEPPQVLSWKPIEAKAAWQVTLFDAHGTRLWRSEPVRGASTTLPAEVITSLQPGQRYFWSVDAQGTAGARLGPFSFTLSTEP
jgi:hypothetical protein